MHQRPHQHHLSMSCPSWKHSSAYCHTVVDALDIKLQEGPFGASEKRSHHHRRGAFPSLLTMPTLHHLTPPQTMITFLLLERLRVLLGMDTF